MKTYTVPLNSATQNNKLGIKHQTYHGTSATPVVVTCEAPCAAEVYYTEFIITAAGGETWDLKGSNDNGATYSGSLIPVVSSTGLIAASAALASGTYVIPSNWPFQTYKFTKSAGVQDSTLSFVQVTLPD